MSHLPSSSEDPQTGPTTEHVFRFPIDGAGDPPCLSLKDLLGSHLRALLDVLVPISRGKEIPIDGFALLGERGLVHALPVPEYGKGRQETETTHIYEPRLDYIRRLGLPTALVECEPIFD